MGCRRIRTYIVIGRGNLDLFYNYRNTLHVIIKPKWDSALRQYFCPLQNAPVLYCFPTLFWNVCRGMDLGGGGIHPCITIPVKSYLLPHFCRIQMGMLTCIHIQVYYCTIDGLFSLLGCELNGPFRYPYVCLEVCWCENPSMPHW